jgi:pectate lyase
MNKRSFTNAIAHLIILTMVPLTALSQDGFGSFTTGGAGGTTATVTTAAAFSTAVQSASPRIITVVGKLTIGQVKVASNMTIQGADTSATIIGNLALGNVKNIIIKSLNITNPAGVGSGDGVEVSTCKNVFITHCTLFDCADG